MNAAVVGRRRAERDAWHLCSKASRVEQGSATNRSEENGGHAQEAAVVSRREGNMQPGVALWDRRVEIDGRQAEARLP